MTPRNWNEAACCLACFGLLIGLGATYVLHSVAPLFASLIPAGLAMLADFISNGAEQ